MWLDIRQRRRLTIAAALMLLSILTAACGGGGSGSTGGSDEVAGTGMPRPTREQTRAVAMIVDGGFINVEGPGLVRVVAGSGTHELTYSILHYGTTAETYEVEVETDLEFVDLSGVPSTIDVQPDETVFVSVPIAVSFDAQPGTQGEIVFLVTLLRKRSSFDGATTRITVVPGTN